MLKKIKSTVEQYFNKFTNSNDYIKNAEIIRKEMVYQKPIYLKSLSLLLTPFLAFKLFILSDTKLIFSQISFYVTFKCNLSCESCHALMEYSNLKNPDIQVLIEDSKLVFDTVDYIYNFILTGGEPFLNRDLGIFIEYLFENHGNQFKRILIPTNGTVKPDKNTLEVIKKFNDKINIKISNYGEKSQKIIPIFEEWEITYSLSSFDDDWFETGEPISKHRDKNELKRIFSSCEENKRCNNIFNGEFHLCAQSACGTNFNLIPKYKQFYCDLRGNESIEMKRKHIKSLMDLDYNISCDYCDFALKKGKKKKGNL